MKWTIHTGCANQLLNHSDLIPDKSINCCVTSPPYWGLRDYGTATWDGGDAGCDHKDDAALAERMRQKKSMIAVGERTDGSTRTRVHDEQIGEGIQFRGDCPKCGATRIDAQLGLEPTPEEYVENLVNVFRGVKRVLRDDGTIWVNLGDSYNNFRVSTNGQSVHGGEVRGKFTGRRPVSHALKEKDLCGIPWRVAFALQADGWYLRSDIIWHKPNPMPESVTDRPTKSHEYIFLLSKSPKYWYDADAIREPNATKPEDVARMGDKTNFKYNDERGQGKHGKTSFMAGGTKEEFVEKYYTNGRNKRSVWTVTTKPFKAAHFATFPPKLIEPCILAGCPPDGTVLDPFAGAGTTLLVASQHNRQSIGLELSEEYAGIARDRLSEVQPVMF